MEVSVDQLKQQGRSSPVRDEGKRRFGAVLHPGSMRSPPDAVRAATTAERHAAKMTIVKGMLLGIAAFAAAPASAQTALEWRATLQQIAGNTTTCLSGVRGTISIRKNVLSWTPSGRSTPGWSISLAADGSADFIVPVERAGTSHVKVPAGDGPRLINTVNQSNGCKYRYIPD